MSPQPQQPTQQPTAPTQGATPSVTLQDGTQLDPGVVKVMRALKTVESQGNYNAVGDNGSSYGAYQWNNGGAPLAPGQTPKNWQNAAASVLGDANAPMTPENQNKVAYQQILAYKNAGHDPEEIAALWNGAHVDSTTGKYTYNNPQYGVQFRNAIAQQQSTSGQTGPLPTQGGLPTAPVDPSTQQSPAMTAETTQGQQPAQSGGVLNDIGNAAKAIGNFAFPIVGDVKNDLEGTSSKSALQQAGDLGLSALWFLPFGDIAEGATDVARGIMGAGDAAKVAEATGAASDAARAATVAGRAKVAGNIATGLATGYGADVASNLSQGKTGLSSLKPSLGTAVGGAGAGAIEAGGSLLDKFRGQQATVNKLEAVYEDALGATKSGFKASGKIAAKQGTEPASFLANAGIMPETTEVNGRRIFSTGEMSNTYSTIQQRANDLTNLRDSVIDKANGTASLEALKEAAIEKASTEFSGTARASAVEHINSEFDAYKEQFADPEGNVSIKDMNTIKKDLQSKTNYDATRPTDTTKSNALMATLAKQQVEKAAEEAGAPGLGALNKIIAQHLDFLGPKGLLSKLNGQVVKGGRLGTYVKETIGAGIGAKAGSALGGGPIGDIVVGALGAKAGQILSKYTQKIAGGGSVSAAMIGRMARTEPAVVEQLLKFIDQKAPEGGVAPLLKPAAKNAGGFLRGAFSRSPGQMVRNALRSQPK